MSIRSTLLATLLLAFTPLLFAGEKEFSDIGGNPHTLAGFHGKWVVVNYWATWCPPCLEEIPELIYFHDDHKDRDAVVLGVNLEDIDRDRLAEFVDEAMISYPVIPKSDEMPVLGAVPGLPTTFLVSPEGKVVARQVGPITGEMIERFIENAERQ